MARKTHHVVPSSIGGWDIKKGGSKRSSFHFKRKREAVNKARKISRNQKTELIVHNQNGKISGKDSHGRDPCPPKDKS